MSLLNQAAVAMLLTAISNEVENEQEEDCEIAIKWNYETDDIELYRLGTNDDEHSTKKVEWKSLITIPYYQIESLESLTWKKIHSKFDGKFEVLTPNEVKRDDKQTSFLYPAGKILSVTQRVRFSKK